MIVLVLVLLVVACVLGVVGLVWRVRSEDGPMREERDAANSAAVARAFEDQDRGRKP